MLQSLDSTSKAGIVQGPGTPNARRVCVILAEKDAGLAENGVRLAEDLTTNLKQALPQTDVAVSCAAGDVVQDAQIKAALSADVVVMLISPGFHADPFLNDALVPAVIARHEAGDTLAFAVCARRCIWDARLDRVLVVPSNRESIWGKADAAVVVAKEIAAKVTESALRRPSYESAAHRAKGRALSLEHWRRRCHFGHSEEHIVALQRWFRRDGRVHAGDIVSGRYWVISLLRERGEAEIWNAYDRQDRRDVLLHIVPGLTPNAAASLDKDLTVRRHLSEDAATGVLSTLMTEPGIGGDYFVTERLPETTLAQAIMNRELPWTTCVRELSGVARGLREMCGSGVNHGRVGPDTIYYERSEGHGSGRFRLGWPWLDGLPDVDTIGSRSTSGADMAGFTRAVAFCIHRSVIRRNITRSEYRDLVNGLDCPVEMTGYLRRFGHEDTASAAQDDFLKAFQTALEGDSVIRDNLRMISVPGTAFEMGENVTAHNDQRERDPARRVHAFPSRKVIVSNFEMAKFPITQRLYQHVMAANPSQYKDDQFPVHKVSCIDAFQFCNKLSEREGLEPAYVERDGKWCWRLSADGYRLPTEAEWEYAARGTKRVPFTWGHEPPRAQLSWNGEGNDLRQGNRKCPSRVGEHEAGRSWSGVYDLLGNVFEWCWDWFAPYEACDAPLLDPVGPPIPRPFETPAAHQGGEYRVVRGGAWTTQDADLVRATARAFEGQNVRDPDIGFRVVRGAYANDGEVS